MKTVDIKPTEKTRPAEARQRRWLAQRVEDTMRLLRPREMTTAQMLFSAFGTTQPAGINVGEFPSYKATVNVCRMPKAKGAYMPGTNRLYLRQDFLDAANDNGDVTTHHLLGASVADHETLHFLQYMKVKRGYSEDAPYPDLLWSEKRTPLLDEFNDKAAPETRAKQAAALKKVKRTCKFNNPERYLSSPLEIQARLHQLMAFGYSHWQKLPANRMELFAALKGLGLTMPQSVKDRLHNTGEGRQAVKDFAKPPFFPAAIKQFADHIEFVFQYTADEDRQNHFWETVLPTLYGEMLELYGARDGMERMEVGMSENRPKPLAL